jgi:hypothetical protein
MHNVTAIIFIMMVKVHKRLELRRAGERAVSTAGERDVQERWLDKHTIRFG